MRLNLTAPFLAVVSLAMPMMAFAQDKSAAPDPLEQATKMTQEARFVLLANNLPAYFLAYTNARIVEKSPFETEANYRSRIPKDFPPDKLISLVLSEAIAPPKDGKTTSQNTEDPSFDYDIKKGVLKIYGGLGGRHLLRDGDMIPVQSMTVRSESYKAQNAFGAKVTIDVSHTGYFCFRVKNNKKCAAIIDKDEQRFKMEIIRGAEDAKALSQKCQIVLVLHPISYRDSGAYLLSAHTPTINNPSESEETAYVIDANVVRADLINKETNEVLATFVPK